MGQMLPLVYVLLFVQTPVLSLGLAEILRLKTVTFSTDLVHHINGTLASHVRSSFDLRCTADAVGMPNVPSR